MITEAASENNEIDDIGDDSWMLNLQELLDTLESQVQESTSLQNVEEILLNLEATDTNFHRYNFIKQIKDKLGLELGPLIDNDIERHEARPTSESVLVSDISQNVLHSEQFEKTSVSILESVKIAAEHITETLNSDTFDFFDQIPSAKYSEKEEFFYGDGSMCSTLEGVDFMFMSPERYKSLAKDIDPSKPIATRLHALSVLQQVPQTDLVASDAWENTRKGLLFALDDEVEEVNFQALKFISHLFVSGSSHVVKEYFIILVENLTEYFNDSTSHMISIDAGLDLGDRRNVLLIRKFRLLNEIQQEVSSFWLRYAEKYIEKMMQSLLDLLQIVPLPITDTLGENLMSPLHFIALLDPQATWFKHWMHGLYGRSQLIDCLIKHSGFLVKPIESCISLSKHLQMFDEFQEIFEDPEDYHSFTYTDICYVYFLHSLSIISRLMLYKDARCLFSMSVANKNTVNVKSLLLSFIDILKLCPLKPLNFSKSLFHPVFLIVDIFRSFANAGKETYELCLCDDDVCHALIMPIKELLENKSKISDPLINIAADILAEIASREYGRYQLSYNGTLSNSLNTNDAAIHCVSEIVSKCLEGNAHLNLETNTLASLLCLCQKIYSSSDGIVILKKYNLHKKAYTHLTNQKQTTNLLAEKLRTTTDFEQSSRLQSSSSRKTASHENTAYKRSVQFERELLDNLLSFAVTPKGVELVEETGGFDECIAYMFQSQPIKNRTERYDYGFLCNQVAATTPGVLALDKAGYVTDLLEQTWLHLESYPNDYKKTVLNEIPEDLMNRVSKKIFTSLIMLLSSYPAVYELFGKMPTLPTPAENNREDVNNLVLKGIKNFHEFVNHFILIDSYQKRRLLVHPDQSHLFALNVLASIVTCLDSMLFMQSNFQFQDILLMLQAESQHDSKAFIIDQCSVKRNQILVQVHLLGGPSERTVPPDSLTQDMMSPFPWPLFSSYPVPDVYVSKVHNSAVPMNGESKFKTYFNEINIDALSDPKQRREVLLEIQDIYVTEMKKQTLKGSNEVMPMLLEKVVQIYTLDHTTQVFTISDEELNAKHKEIKLSESDELGIDMVVQYGALLSRSMSSNADVHDALANLIQQSRCFLHGSQTAGHSLVNEYLGFDWFLSVMFLMFGPDNCASTLSFLKMFSTTAHSAYLWMARLNNSNRKTDSQIHPIFSNTCHYIELVLQKELPQVYAAFRLSGYPPAQICQHWLRQCFLNYLDWSDVIWYISTCVIMGIDYQVYFTVSILKHLQQKILLYTQNNELAVFLKSSPIKRFRMHDHLDFMKKLEVEYREVFMKDLLDF